MAAAIRRFTIPALSILAGTGLQLSGIQAPIVAAILWLIAGVWGVIAFVTWEPVRTRAGDARAWIGERSPVLIRSPLVLKSRASEPEDPGAPGFLDFEAMAVEAMKRMTRTLSSIARETDAMSKTMAKYTPRFAAAATLSSDARRALGREAGSKLDAHARRMERWQVDLRLEIEVMTTNFLERLKSAPAEAATEIRPAIVSMRDAVAESRPGIVSMREATTGLRNQSVQQAMNQAADRLVEVEGRLVSDFDAVTRFTTEALRMIDEKSQPPTRQVRRRTVRKGSTDNEKPTDPRS
jgi:hypothetical protein